MKTEKENIMKNLILGDDFGLEFTGLNLDNLGFSLNDFDVGEDDLKGDKKNDNENKADQKEEILSDLSENEDINNLTVSKKNVGKIKEPFSINNKKFKPIKDDDNSETRIFLNENQFEKPLNVTKEVGQFEPKEMPKEAMNIILDSSSYQNNRNDINLKLICESHGEKIYRLSDLFIPIDPDVVRRIEKYISKTMNNTEKEIKDKQNESNNKSSIAMEIDELKQIIKKSKRNQKFQKINFTYNEKYFDRTCFLDNINQTIGVTENAEAAENLDKISNLPIKITEHFRYNPVNMVDNDKDDIENKLINSLFLVNNNLKICKNKEDFKSGELSTVEQENEEISSENRKIEIPNNDDNHENDEILQFNENFIFNQRDQKDSEESMSIEENISQIDIEPTNDFEKNKSKSKIGDGINSIHASSRQNLVQERDESVISLIKENVASNLNKTQNSGLTFLDLEKDKKQQVTNENDNNFFTLSRDKEYADKTFLFDKYKKKRHKHYGYINESFKNGDFLSHLLINHKNPQSIQLFNSNSKKIFDLNDYNMNFEIINVNQNNKNENQHDDVLSSMNKLYQINSNSLRIGKSKMNILTHAKCAYNLNYYKLNLTEDEIKEFHRPNFCRQLLKEKKKKQFSFTISDKFDISGSDKFKSWKIDVITKNYLKKKERKRIKKNILYMNSYEIFKDRFKLSLVEGKYVLFENLDEYPLFISNFGMASKLKKFIYSNKLGHSSTANPNIKLNEVEAKTKTLMGPFGNTVLLPPNKNPLLGHIDQNELKGITVVDNNMYRAPVFYEKINNSPSHETQNKIGSTTQKDKNKKYMNFLLIMKKSKDGKEGFYLRELEHLYVKGQEEPKLEVYPPQSKQYNNYLKKKIQTYTYKLYNEIGFNAGINFKVFSSLFPKVTEQILKKNFREMKIDIDKNICYYNKTPTEDNNMQITPENICQYETCQFGLSKLRELGILSLTNPEKISYSTNKLIQQVNDEKQQFYGRLIESELLSTPWNITQNFLQVKQTKGMLSIKGIGDPSNGNGGYSFLKMPVKTYNENNKSLKEEIDILKKSCNNMIKTVTGTDADLRKLSKEDIKSKLIQLGEDEDYINRLSRWERVSLLRYKSSQVASIGYEGDITKYARGTRMSVKVQREAYQSSINEMFKKQIKFITNEIKDHELNIINEESSDEDKKNYSNNNKYYNEQPNSEERSKLISNNNNSSMKKPNKKKLKGDSKKNEEKIIKVYKKSGNATNQQGSSIFNSLQSEVEDQQSQTKIKFDMNSLGIDVEFLKKKKKSSIYDSIYEYEDKTNPLISRKRRDGVDKQLNEIFEDIIDRCIKQDLTKLFHKPVKRKEYPDYYNIIQNPIDLYMIKNKTKRSEYKTLEQFTSDIDLLAKNAEIYNGESHEVTKNAYKLKELAYSRVEIDKERIENYQNQIGNVSIFV